MTSLPTTCSPLIEAYQLARVLLSRSLFFYSPLVLTTTTFAQTYTHKPVTFSPSYNSQWETPDASARISPVGQGTKGTVAMLFGGSSTGGTWNKVDFSLSNLSPNTRYWVRFKARRDGEHTEAKCGVQGLPGNEWTPVYSAWINGGIYDRSWSNKSFEFTTGASVSNLYLSFTVRAPKGVSVFVDEIEIVPYSQRDNPDRSNLFSHGFFERSYDRRGRLIAFKDLPDRTVASSAFGAYHCDSKYDNSVLQYALKASHIQTLILEALPNHTAPITDIEQIRQHNKHFYIFIQNNIIQWKPLPADSPARHSLVPDWKSRIDTIAESAISRGGTSFAGFYFDEPSFYWTNEDFIAVTKYLADKYPSRRIFVISCTEWFAYPSWHGLDPKTYVPGPNDPPYMTREALRHVTDLGYNNYWYWGANQEQCWGYFKNAMANTIPNHIKIWFVLPAGTIAKGYTDTEESCAGVLSGFSAIMNDLQSSSRLGGALLYTFHAFPAASDGFVHGNGKKYLIPDSSGKAVWNLLYRASRSMGETLKSGKMLVDVNLFE